MEIQSIIGKLAASMVGPGDTVILNVDRYLTGQQITEITRCFRKKLPRHQLVVLGKGVSAQIVKADQSYELTTKASNE